MKISLGATGVLAVVGVAAIALLYWKRGAVANAVNPLNHDNVFATGVNGIGAQIFTDPDAAGKNADGSWSLGGWIYDITHGGPVDATSVPAATADAPREDHYDAMGTYLGNW